MKKNKLIIGMVLLLGVLLINFNLTFAYVSSNPSYTQPGMSSFDYLQSSKGGGFELYPVLDREKCGVGQDFIVQVAPEGCTPIVRSDLLEEQNVPVFCPLMATKVNPLIDVEAIDYITFKGQYPEGITGIGFHPAQAALSNSYRTILNSPVLANIGYAVIILKQNPVEANMPENIKGSVVANIKYDIKNAFGVGQALYYLPEMLPEQWNENYQQYGFWKGKGYLRAESVGDTGAIISVYLDKDKRLSTKNLQVGEISKDLIYVPGYYCLAGLQLRLDSLDVADSRALIEVDGDIYEVADGEKFLDNKCTLVNLKDKGVLKDVTISCDDDNNEGRFTLSIRPRIKLNVGSVEGEYDIGEFIGSTGTGQDERFIYLGGARTSDNSNSVDKLEVYFVSYPKSQGETLSESEINKIGITSKWGIGEIVRLYSGLATGEKYEKVAYGSNADVFGKTISVEGFGGVNDFPLSEEFKDYFLRAKADYEKIINDFPNEKIDGLEETYSEKAFIELIELASRTSQMKTMTELCDEFVEKYPNSIGNIKECKDDLKKSNTKIPYIDLMIDGRTKTISFEGVNEPDFEDYGTTISISGTNNYNQADLKLIKNQKIYLSAEQEFFQLDEVNQDYIKVSGRVKNNRGNPNDFNEKINLNSNEFLGSTNYQVSVHSINLKKVAKVSVVPNIRYAETQANFTFDIGIEKRAIQLSPEKISSKLENLDKQITKWEGISDKLNKLTKGLKTGCFAYGSYLTIKNLLANMDGKSIARQEVMRGEKGWYDYCKSEIEKSSSLTMDKCLYDNSEKIDSDVEKLSKIIDAQNEDIKKLETVKETLLEGREVDDEKFMSVYPDAVLSDLKKLKLNEFGTSEEELKTILTKQGYDNGNFYKDDLRDSQRYARILSDNSLKGTKLYDIAKTELTNKINEIKGNSKGFAEKITLANNLNIDPAKISFLQIGKNANKDFYNGLVISDAGQTLAEAKSEFVLPDNTPIQIVQGSDGRNFIAVLDNSVGTDKLPIKKDGDYQLIFDTDGNFVANPPNELSNLYFQKYDETSYKNPLSKENAKVRYYETEPYKGYPAVVPFDLSNGWYAAIKQTLAIGGAIRAYDESGKVVSFYLCNVGKDKKMDFFNDLKDDDCEMIVFQGARYVADFPGLDEAKTNDLVDDAVKAINQAQNQYSKGVRQVTISTKRGRYVLDVGTPAVNIPEMQCQDFMSPSECMKLFNLCDPVICPSSRCNLGGAYYVDDVIRSGIIGGLTLCLPNRQQGIAFPFCLSGINAGVENLLSMSKSYRDCLQESLDTGKTIGICDQVHSIYLCEFLWRQVSPMSGVLIPKLLEIVTGKRVKGGGEYLGIQSAWTNAENSVNYLINYYGANSWKAFKARSTESAGTEVCKNFISVVGPKTDDFIDALTEPDSPSQYTAWFEEIPFTTATVPPISQYKVFYHIYSGKDMGAYYRVYLKSPTGGSLYQVNPTILVDSGYIGVGESATQTKDFTASSGYQQLCVVINSQEECGFKQVSTEYALDLIKDKYVEEQAGQKDIATEKACVSGTSSVYSFLNPNLEEGASEWINPNLYNYGVVRICATDNPGSGTDANVGTNKSRWVSVGYCGNTKIKCWLDTQSVKDVVKREDIESGILSDTANAYVDAITKEGTYLAEDSLDYTNAIEQFKKIVGDIGENIFGAGVSGNYVDGEFVVSDRITSVKDVINNIDVIYDKVIMSSQKVKLLSYNARALNILGRDVYDKIIFDKELKATIEQQEQEYEEIEKETQSALQKKYDLDDDTLEKVLKATKCEDCGKGINRCELEECLAIGENLARNCLFDSETKKCAEGVGLPKSDLDPKATDKDLLQRLAIYNQTIKDAFLKYMVSENLIKAIISQESDAVEDVTDGLGSYGLMQVSLDAARDVATKYNNDEHNNFLSAFQFSKYAPDSNIKLGTAYYKILYDYYSQWNSDENAKKMALASYNWGRGNIDEHCKKEFEPGYKWENCKLMSNKVLQYISNILKYEEEFEGKITEEKISPTTDVKVGDYWFLIAAAIAPYKQQQLNDADTDIIKFADCIAEDYYINTGKELVVTSLTDNNLYRQSANENICDLDNNAEKYNNKDNCVHTKNSCHYYSENGELKSRAVDIRSRDVFESPFQDAFDLCKNTLDENAVLIDETNNEKASHYHISIKGCDSGVNERDEVVEQSDAEIKIYESDIDRFIAKGEKISELDKQNKNKIIKWTINEKGTGAKKNIIGPLSLYQGNQEVDYINLLYTENVRLSFLTKLSIDTIKLELAHPHTKNTIIAYSGPCDVPTSIGSRAEDLPEIQCDMPIDKRLFGNLQTGDMIQYKLFVQKDKYSWDFDEGGIEINDPEQREDLLKEPKLIQKINNKNVEINSLDLDNLNNLYLLLEKDVSWFGGIKSLVGLGDSYDVYVDLKGPSGNVYEDLYVQRFTKETVLYVPLNKALFKDLGIYKFFITTIQQGEIDYDKLSISTIGSSTTSTETATEDVGEVPYDASTSATATAREDTGEEVYGFIGGFYYPSKYNEISEFGEKTGLKLKGYLIYSSSSVYVGEINSATGIINIDEDKLDKSEMIFAQDLEDNYLFRNGKFVRKSQ